MEQILGQSVGPVPTEVILSFFECISLIISAGPANPSAGPPLVGDGDLLAMRGRVLELADDARPVIGDGDEAAAVSVGQQLVAAIRNTPVRSPDSMSWAGDA